MLDTEHILKDAGAVTSSGYGTVDSEAQVIDLGEGLVRGNVVIDVSQMSMNSNDELYQICLMGGDDASFTKTVALAMLELGPRETLEDNFDSKIARVVLPFQSEKNGVVYPYVRIRHVISGTGPSINYTARIEKDLPVRGLISQTVTTTTTV